MKYTRYFISLCLVLFFGSLSCYFPINVFRPFDINLRPPAWKCGTWQITSYYEGGLHARAVNGSHAEGNTLHIWNQTEDAISMLKGFAEDTPMTALLHEMEAAVGGVLLDNGIRGHFRLTGDFHFTGGFGIVTRYHMPHNFNVGMYIPFYAMSLKNIKFEDQTPSANIDMQDVVVKEMLTDNFFATVASFDPTLQLQRGWKRVGLGDIVFEAEWRRDFPQPKPILRNVNLDVRAGITLPTGKREEENELFAIPFGNDGAAGIIAGGGVELTWFDCVRGLIDLEIIQLFGSTRPRRIKTNVQQTDFLLLAKDSVQRDFGLVQRYNLALDVNPIVTGLSGSVVYQFFKKSKDTLAVSSTRYSNLAVNSAESLKEWTMHQLIFKLAYDFQDVVSECAALKPQIMAFYKFPLFGKRALLLTTAGFAFTLNF